MSIRNKYAFAGIGLTKQGKIPEMDPDMLATQAIFLALKDAGMRKDEIDGYIFQSGNPGGIHGVTPLLTAGIPAKFCWEMPMGGCYGISMVMAATSAIEAGLCRTCVILHATSTSVRPAPPGPGNEKRSTPGAYGCFGPVAQGAWIARRWMHLYGLTRRQLGSVAVTLRAYANKRPEAVMFQKTLSMDEYLNARMIVEPLCLYDCCLINDGAVALIITSAERARQYRQPPVKIMGYGIDHSLSELRNSSRSYLDLDSLSGRKAGEDAFKMAGVTIKDVDVAELYDAFTPFLLSQLESYGVCSRGEAGPFVEAGNLGLHGAFPSNTSGTELSWSYLQGFSHLTEGIRQMRSESGECQVEGAEICLVTGLGTPAPGGTATCCILGR